MGWVATALVACDDKLYLGGRSTLVIVDPAALEVTRVVPPDSTGNGAFELSQLLCSPGDRILYGSDWPLKRFSLDQGTWLPAVASSFPSNGLAQSKRDPRVVYLGYQGSGRLAIYRSDLDSVVAVQLPRSSGEWVFDLAVLPDDRKVYITRYQDGGILVADPWADSVLGRIGVGGSWFPDLGRTDALTLSADGTRLYVAVIDGDPRGVLEIDTETDQIVRTLTLPWSAIDVALSPDEQRMFVTTQDLFPELPSENVLVDVTTWEPLASFPRPRASNALRWDRQIVFSDDGKLVFVGHNFDVDVYLVRR
jgi:DNA-binding beta-propeller fold protein YncE